MSKIIFKSDKEVADFLNDVYDKISEKRFSSPEGYNLFMADFKKAIKETGYSL